MPSNFKLPLLTLLLLCSPIVSASGQDDAQTAADKRKIAVLMRLTHIKVAEKPKLKASVVRFLKTVTDESEFISYAKRFDIDETKQRLWEIALESKSNESRANAASLLIDREDPATLQKKIQSVENPADFVLTLGLVASAEAIEILKPLVTADSLPAAAKNAAVKGLGRQKVGQQFLLELAQSKKLPEECSFTTANILLSSSYPTIKDSAAKVMKLPAAAGSQPIAPIAELVKRTGNIENGKRVFSKQGTCANCHKVAGAGKEVGPDLSEIGSKLSRQAMYEAILNPSLAVSHNYETYLVQTIDGLSFSGILISETDEAIVLRSAEAVSKEFLKDDLEGMKKSKKSLMPNDLQKNFSESDLVDLVEYLMTLQKKS